MHTIVAYSESLAPGGVFVPINGVADQHIKVLGDGIYIGEFNHIIGAMACVGDEATEVRLVSPSLRRINPFYISPIDLALHPDGELHHCFTNRNAIPLDVNEALECWVNSAEAVGEQMSVIVGLAPGAITPVSGRMYTVNFEFTITHTVGGWVFSEIDFIDELPVGTYEVVGAAVICATGIAFRFVPVGTYYRPGAPSLANVEFSDDMAFRFGNLGSWFSFSTVQPPGIEVIASAVSGPTKYQGYMDILVR